jgi:hypothetical protein
MGAFRTTEAGVCGAGCGQPVEVGDLVAWINDAMVHLECEDPEKAIAAGLSFDVGEPSEEERERLDVAVEFALPIVVAAVAGFTVSDRPVTNIKSIPVTLVEVFEDAPADIAAEAIEVLIRLGWRPGGFDRGPTGWEWGVRWDNAASPVTVFESEERARRVALGTPAARQRANLLRRRPAGAWEVSPRG